MQRAAQRGQQFGLVIGAEGAVQQLGQGFFLQALPALGLPPGQNGHKSHPVGGGCLASPMASPTIMTLRLSYPQASMVAMELALLPTSWPKMMSACWARP